LQGDQRLPHDSGKPVNVDDLLALGVYYYHLPELESVDNLARDRGYKNRDEITVSPKTMGDVYESKVKMFFAEHLHEDEEIRYIRGGRGYFDVRSKDDDWVRVLLEKDDLLILPAGIYHRFTTDETNVRSPHALDRSRYSFTCDSTSTRCVCSRRTPNGRP
jgi:1,2-dihydroxy-3-keto-5-methylthiopentene dioxygenase